MYGYFKFYTRCDRTIWPTRGDKILGHPRVGMALIVRCGKGLAARDDSDQVLAAVDVDMSASVEVGDLTIGVITHGDHALTASRAALASMNAPMDFAVSGASRRSHCER